MYCHFKSLAHPVMRKLEHLACIRNTSHEAATRDLISMCASIFSLIVMLCGHLLSCCCNECKEWAGPLELQEILENIFQHTGVETIIVPANSC